MPSATRRRTRTRATTQMAAGLAPQTTWTAPGTANVTTGIGTSRARNRSAQARTQRLSMPRAGTATVDANVAHFVQNFAGILNDVGYLKPGIDLAKVYNLGVR